jgi:hypothetical protein
MNYAEQLYNGAYNFLSVSIYLHILFRKEARLVLFYSPNCECLSHRYKNLVKLKPRVLGSHLVPIVLKNH